MSGKIAIVGSNNFDLVTYVERMPRPGETIEAPEFEMGFGGKGANQAIAAARLGGDVMMVTRVGDDLFGGLTLDNFQQAGIDTRHVKQVPGTSGVAPIFVDPSGENAILIIKGANKALTPAEIDLAAEDLKTCDLIVLQLEVPLETVYHTLAFAARHGIETLLNPAPAAADLDPERIRQATFLVPNESELATLTGLPVDSGEEVEAAARALIAKGIRTVIVTLGSRGALLVTARGAEPIPPVRVAPVDTTGAGDAFIGAFACFYCEGHGVAAALRRAARYAALSTTRRGAQKSYASLAEFEAFCRELG